MFAKRIAIYLSVISLALTIGISVKHEMGVGYRSMGPLAQPMTPLVGKNGKVVWVPQVNQAEAALAGVNINTVTAASQSASCLWNAAPYCRVNVAGTALTTLTLGGVGTAAGAPTDGSQYIVEFVQGTTGAPVTWPTGTNGVFGPAGQTAPTVCSSNSCDDIYVLQWTAAANGYTVVSAMQAGGQVNNSCAGVAQASAGVAATTAACLSGAKVVQCIPQSATTPGASTFVNSSVSGTTITCLYGTANANPTTGWARIQ